MSSTTQKLECVITRAGDEYQIYCPNWRHMTVTQQKKSIRAHLRWCPQLKEVRWERNHLTQVVCACVRHTS